MYEEMFEISLSKYRCAELRMLLFLRGGSLRPDGPILDAELLAVYNI